MSLGKLSVRALLDLSVLFLYRASQGIYLPDCLCRLACLFQLISYPSVASIWGAPGICTSSTSSTQLQPASNYLISDRPSAASFSSLPVRLSPAIHPPVSMYSIKNSGWKLMHVMCIFVHLGLTVTAAVSHLYNLGKEDRLLVGGSPVYWNYLTATNGEPCHGLVLMGRSGPESWVTSNAITQTLLITCIAVGIIGLILNIALFTVLLSIETHNISLTEGEEHYRRQVVTFFGSMVNLLLAGAGVGLAAVLGVKTVDSKSLIAPLVWASIQAPLALVMAAFDAVKTYREGQDLLD